MERRSWLWKRKSSSEKSGGGGETESSGSVSSERYSDEQDLLRASVNSSPGLTQSPEVTSKSVSDKDNETSKCLTVKSSGDEGNETVKSLTEKLSAALSSITAKEELVKQHATVAEEAVLGWEKAEKEVTSLKKQLDAFVKKNSSLEDRVSHLDGALKECVRQLRQSREEQEQKLREAIFKKTNEWGSEKSQLEIQIIELQAKLEVKTEMTASADHKFSSQVEALQKENSTLKEKLASLMEDLQVRTLEMELMIKSAETASKQNLDSIKKRAKLEAECRRLHAAAQKSLFPNDHKIISNSLYVESLTDSQSDSGERLVGLDNEPSCSDSWASALIAELDQFKSEKSSARNLANSSETDLMDDFLEMERLAALPAADHESSGFEHEVELESLRNKDTKHIAELDLKIEKITMENVELKTSLGRNQNELKIKCEQLQQSEAKLVELQRQLNLVNGEKHSLNIELEGSEARKSELELQLQLTEKETGELKEQIRSLEGKIQEERLSTVKLLGRCQEMEVMVAKVNEMQLELESANAGFLKLQEKTTILEKALDKERAFSSEIASRCHYTDSLVVKKREIESQLELSNLELAKLHEKVDFLEKKNEEKELFANAITKSVETEREKLEHQLITAYMDVNMLKQNVKLLETEVEDTRAMSAKLAIDANESETKRKEMVHQLEVAYKEVDSLKEKLHLVEKQVEKEKASSTEFAVKCQSLQHELSSKMCEDELLKHARSNGVVKIRQHNEVAVAAGRLEECQKTIASLKLQVKSLASIDVFVPEKPEFNGDSWKSKLDSRSSPER